MRLSMVMVVVACTSPTTDLDRLHDFVAKSEINCGSHDYQYCTTDAVGQQSLSCLNDALASGARASYGAGTLDRNWFNESVDYFTVDHEVYVFTDYPSGNADHDSEYAVAGTTCLGPFGANTSKCAYNLGSNDTVLGPGGCP